MARLLTAGAEFNDLTADGLSGGGTTPATASNANPRSGTYHYHCTALSSGYAIIPLTTTTTTVYSLRAYFYISSYPAAGNFVALTELATPTGITNTEVCVASDGSVALGTAGGANTGRTVTAPLATYFRLEVQWKIDTSSSANGTIEARVNGVTIDQGIITGTIGAALITQAWVGITPGSTNTGTIDVDDIAVNDSTGAAQTSWPGDANVVLLRPTADSAVGTGWTLGNTTATGGNAWQRLDNAPPDSAADLTTAADADQIRNATSNANVNYDATMTTYAAAGISASDTINVVIPMVATGSISATSAKAGTVGVVSNPTIANVALGAGGTAGAFWSGAIMGTYVTGNKWSFGTTTYAPTVTVGSAPVMRITQVTSSTRIAIVTEMGIYVDYTPATPPPPGVGMADGALPLIYQRKNR